MTTTTDLTTLDAELEKAEQAEQRARDKARKARETRQRAAAERAQKAEAAEHEFMVERQRDYLADFGGRIDAAWSAFIEAVRSGGDVHAAWVAYRTTRRIVAEEHYAIRRHFEAIEDARILALREQVSDLNTEASRLDTTPRSDRGSQWRERLAEWNRVLAEYEGRESFDPEASPHAVAGPGLITSSERIGAPRGGVDPRVGESFTEAFDQAVRIIEDEATAEAARQRREAQGKYVEEALS